MRSVSLLSLLILLGACAGASRADKLDPNEKPWKNDPVQFRADYPEVEPNDACPGPQQLQCEDRIVCGSYDPSSDDDFYQVFLTAGWFTTIGTEACDGEDVDTWLELYDPSCQTRLAYDDDSGPGLFSLISYWVPPSTGWYNIKTFSYGHQYTGNYRLFVSCLPDPPPGLNDRCNPSYAIQCGEGVLDGDMTWDNNDYDPGSGGCADGYPEAGKDVAWRMDLPEGAILDLTYSTPNFDAAFYIVTDCDNVPGTCVVGADAAYDIEVIHYVVPAAGTYWLILDHYGTNTGAGPWTLSYDIVCEQPSGACCLDGECTITHPEECGGEYMGDGSLCQPDPCALIPVAGESWGRIKASYRRDARD